jgi:hypothetical protein
LLGPFYYYTALSDWNFSFFDVHPQQANAKIEKGFGKGIYTNQVYSELYKWISAKAETYSQPNDYAISYVVSPMVHMISKRRPSLDDTYITFQKPDDYYETAIEKMKERHREPSIAFVFERMPALIPVSLDEKIFSWPERAFHLNSSDHPISRYIKKNMVMTGEFVISKEADHIIRCFIDPKITKQKIPWDQIK